MCGVLEVDVGEEVKVVIGDRKGGYEKGVEMKKGGMGWMVKKWERDLMGVDIEEDGEEEEYVVEVKEEEKDMEDR